MQASPKVTAFEITLNNPTGIYRPGDIVSGSLIVNVTEDVKMNGIYVLLQGQAEVMWEDKRAAREGYFEYERYFKECFVLWGRAPGQKTTGPNPLLPAGQHEYPFKYRLPRDLPSTYETPGVHKGRVFYLVKSKLDSPEDSITDIREKPFLVLSSLDLNKEPRISEAIQVRKDRFTCCMCCKTGPVSCVLRLDRSGYVPGEDIYLNAEIQNLSRRLVQSTYVTMQQIVYLYAQGHTQPITFAIFRISGGKIRPGDAGFYNDVIHIPPLPPSRMESCRLLEIEYVIEIGVDFDGHIVEASVPIVLGTVPLSCTIPAGRQVSPAFARYSHATGDIEEYDSSCYDRGVVKDVYTYYGSLFNNREPEITPQPEDGEEILDVQV